MNLNISNQVTKTYPVADYLFNIVMVLAATAVFAYALLVVKVHLQQEQLTSLNSQIASYASTPEGIQEQQVVIYKRKVDDFAALLSQHKSSASIFNFIEGNTITDVWFSNFTMSSTANEVKLEGQAKTMDALSRQVQVLEDNKKYIQSVNLTNSQLSPTDTTVRFTLNIALEPTVFYQANNNSGVPANAAAN